MTARPSESELNDKPLTVVLTGGIASGKSAVSRLFQGLGVPVIDTDVIAKEVVEPGQDALGRIVEAFGPGILRDDGTLNRVAMRRLVFADSSARTCLEHILHPVIMQRAAEQISKLDTPYCILVIPLYAESPSPYPADRVLVIDVDEGIQIQRLVQRDSIDRSLAERMLAAQATREQRLALADDTILNDGSRADLEKKVRDLHTQYLSAGAEN